MDGAFIEIDDSTGAYSAQRWLTELTAMKNLNMTKVIIASSVNESTAYYPTSISGHTDTGLRPIANILNAADALGMDVHVGLLLTDSWWNKTDTTYLNLITLSNEAVASELYTLYSSHSSLKGFYIPQEIDNATYVDETYRQRLVNNFLKPLSDHIKALNSSLKVSEAPFYSDADQQPTDYQTWWNNTLSGTPNLDLIIPQDGIGAQHATYTEVAEYFTALKNACDANSRTLWDDLEIYNTVADPVPADLGRIIKQISTEASLVSKITCWEWSYYLSPTYSIQSLDLYDNYYRYLLGQGQIQNVSSGKNYTLSIAPNASYPDSGNELTDGKDRINWSDQVGWFNKPYVTVEVDLGEVVPNIYNFRAYLMRSSSSDVNLPQEMDISVSENGTSFTNVAPLEAVMGEDESIDPYQLLLSNPVSARYVKFSIKASSNWLMLSEIGVYAKE